MIIHRFGKFVFLALLVIVTCLLGCSKNASPPPPLAADQIPAELQKAYSNAKPEYKAWVEKVIAGLQQKDYPAASAAIQWLFNAPEGTKQQRLATVRSSLTINQLLADAQSQGDTKAAAAIQFNKKYK